MGTAYQYKLRPNKEQTVVIEMWLELLRRQYNYRLSERFSWWEENRCPVNTCPLRTGNGKKLCHARGKDL
ncbi:MAG: helix-turn-helix domain-containing protein [Okeania sp. SIO3B3]|nr:helix-turn-helix domain-containing protein [Okeania sp. SIO3B3]